MSLNDTTYVITKERVVTSTSVVQAIDRGTYIGINVSGAAGITYDDVHGVG